MTITVTAEDIKNGNASTDACPITMALQRQFKNKKISVSRNFIRVPKKRSKDWKLIELPKAARNFTLSYHVYNYPQPFSFELAKKDCLALKG